MLKIEPILSIITTTIELHLFNDCIVIFDNQGYHTYAPHDVNVFYKETTTYFYPELLSGITHSYHHGKKVSTTISEQKHPILYKLAKRFNIHFETLSSHLVIEYTLKDENGCKLTYTKQHLPDDYNTFTYRRKVKKINNIINKNQFVET